MNLRIQSISHKEEKGLFYLKKEGLMLASEQFGKRTFSLSIMEKVLPKHVFKNINLASLIKKAKEFLPKMALNLQIQFLSKLPKSLSRQGDLIIKKVIIQMEKTRAVVDLIEPLLDDDMWPLPKYRKCYF